MREGDRDNPLARRELVVESLVSVDGSELDWTRSTDGDGNVDLTQIRDTVALVARDCGPATLIIRYPDANTELWTLIRLRRDQPFSSVT